MSALLEAVRNKSEEQAYHWSKSEGWATVEQLMTAAGNSYKYIVWMYGNSFNARERL